MQHAPPRSCATMPLYLAFVATRTDSGKKNKQLRKGRTRAVEVGFKNLGFGVFKNLSNLKSPNFRIFKDFFRKPKYSL